MLISCKLKKIEFFSLGQNQVLVLSTNFHAPQWTQHVPLPITRFKFKMVKYFPSPSSDGKYSGSH